MQHERSLFNLDTTVYLYDLTSTYFEGQCPRNDKAKLGQSRDKRPDCKQVLVGLVVKEVAAAQVLVSTIPADVASRYAGTFAAIPVLLDAVYDPWPTPLAAAVVAAGGRVISGLQMLLHQAFPQVEQFTGLPAPREAMTCALEALD